MCAHRNDTNRVLLGRRTVLTLRVSNREMGGGPRLWSEKECSLQVIVPLSCLQGKRLRFGVVQLVLPDECIYDLDQWPLRLVDVTATKVAM